MQGVLFITSVAAVLCVSASHRWYPDRLPNGNAATDNPGNGLTCRPMGHEGCVPGAPRNPFGLDFVAAGRRWTQALCEKDSDGDGLTNGEELGDPCCVWQVGAAPARSTSLSHPGEASSTNDAPKCAPLAEAVTDAPTPSDTPLAVAVEEEEEESELESSAEATAGDAEEPTAGEDL